MTRIDDIIDHIHGLTEEANALAQQGKTVDAALLFEEAERLAVAIRDEEEVYSPV